MKIKSIIHFIIALSAILMLSVSSVFAQEIDFNSMSKEQIMVLLTQISDRLGLEISQSETSAEEIPEPTGTPYATAVPDATTEQKRFEPYINKKLIIGTMPSYMFIQPTAPVEKETDSPKDLGKKSPDQSSCPVGQQCVDDHYCFYDWIDGQCLCMCG